MKLFLGSYYIISCGIIYHRNNNINFFLFDTSFKNLNQESNQKFVLILGHIYRFFWKPNQLKEIELNQTEFFFGNLFDSVRKLNVASIILRKKKF